MKEKWSFLKKKEFSEEDLFEIVNALLAEDGCPWDRAQTHESIKKSAIEEAYELSEAITNNNKENTVEELGDLLLQVLLHVAMAERDGEYTKADVYRVLANKLISRHTHVFGNVTAHSEKEALDNWNINKAKEHHIDSVTQNLRDVPKGMSALMRSQKIQSRAGKGGYEFSSREQIVEKIQEELREYLNAKENEKNAEGGDLLFAVVNLLRYDKIDSETALLGSVNKFVSRVEKCEDKLNGKSVKELSQKDFDELWENVKND